MLFGLSFMVISSMLDNLLARFASHSLQSRQSQGLRSEPINELVARGILKPALGQILLCLLTENFGLRTADAHGFLPIRELYRLHHATPLVLELLFACLDAMHTPCVLGQFAPVYYSVAESITLCPTIAPAPTEAEVSGSLLPRFQPTE